METSLVGFPAPSTGIIHPPSLLVKPLWPRRGQAGRDRAPGEQEATTRPERLTPAREHEPGRTRAKRPGCARPRPGEGGGRAAKRGRAEPGPKRTHRAAGDRPHGPPATWRKGGPGAVAKTTLPGGTEPGKGAPPDTGAPAGRAGPPDREAARRGEGATRPTGAARCSTAQTADGPGPVPAAPRRTPRPHRARARQTARRRPRKRDAATAPRKGSRWAAAAAHTDEAPTPSQGGGGASRPGDPAALPRGAGGPVPGRPTCDASSIDGRLVAAAPWRENPLRSAPTLEVPAGIADGLLR